ncbi:MAG TPA: hypothetical protein VMB71_11220, partial [Acetobacteraceae bacterium]|nr:hypothetical protein [Acetobacteraceae bacterium]
MNAIVEFVSGRCTNELFCAVASAREVVRVPVGASFVCNQCGKPLVAGDARSGRGAGSTALIIGTGMALT